MGCARPQTWSTVRSFLPTIPEKSASAEKMFPSPRAWRTGLRSWVDSIRNLGSRSKVRYRSWNSSAFSNLASSSSRADSTWLRITWLVATDKVFLLCFAHAFAANCICEIPCLSTRWVRSFNIIHELSSIEKKNLGRRYLSRDSNPGLQGEKRERYLCAMPSPFNIICLTRVKLYLWQVGIVFGQNEQHVGLLPEVGQLQDLGIQVGDIDGLQVWKDAGDWSSFKWTSP